MTLRERNVRMWIGLGSLLAALACGGGAPAPAPAPVPAPSPAPPPQPAPAPAEPADAIEIGSPWKEVAGLVPAGAKVENCDGIQCAFELDHKVTKADGVAVAKALTRAGWKREEIEEGTVTRIRLTNPRLHEQFPNSFENGETYVSWSSHPNLERRISILINGHQ